MSNRAIEAVVWVLALAAAAMSIGLGVLSLRQHRVIALRKRIKAHDYRTWGWARIVSGIEVVVLAVAVFGFGLGGHPEAGLALIFLGVFPLLGLMLWLDQRAVRTPRATAKYPDGSTTIM